MLHGLFGTIRLEHNPQIPRHTKLALWALLLQIVILSFLISSMINSENSLKMYYFIRMLNRIYTNMKFRMRMSITKSDAHSS